MPKERKIEAVLFDLDGTLIFLEQSEFLAEYFKSIAAYTANKGYDAKAFMEALRVSTGLMFANDGSRDNKSLFWDKFFVYYGKYDESLIKDSDDFYISDFKNLREFARENACAKRAIELAHKGGKKVVLATNPVFPMTAQIERLRWFGLDENDFDLITSYENSSFCKPSPKYYLEVCQKLGVKPENALMIGNDEGEDMKGASEAGLMCYLATDCRIMAKDFIWTGHRGTFEQALRLLDIV